MKKVFAFLLLLLTYSCTKIKYGPIDTFNMFDIRFYQDFEDNTIGEYMETEWEEDWNYPAWSDRDISPEIIRNEDADNGTKVMRWHFPEGSIGPTEGGGQWYTELDSGYYELYFSYRIKFKPGFNWVLGGKIPGIRGGPSWEGFGAPGWSDGFIVLLMWNNAPRIRFYYYHHDMDHLYGNSEDWNYIIESGIWYTVTIRIVMNTLNENGGNNDGILEGFINGELVCQLTDLRFRNLETINSDRLCITSFFGGDSEEWAAQRDEWIDMDDFIVFTYKNAMNIPKGNIPSPDNRRLVLPYSYEDKQIE